MQYMIVLFSDETQEPDFEPGTAEFEEMMSQWMSYSQMLIDGGHYLDGAGLAPSATATVLSRDANGAETITDGPFIEAKEQLGGYYLIEAADLDEALALARQVPIPVGSFEIRPVMGRLDDDAPAA